MAYTYMVHITNSYAALSLGAPYSKSWRILPASRRCSLSEVRFLGARDRGAKLVFCWWLFSPMAAYATSPLVIDLRRSTTTFWFGAGRPAHGRHHKI